MAKLTTLDSVLIGVFSVVMGFVAFALSGSLFNLFFVAIVIAVLYDYSYRLNEVRDKLSQLESKLREKKAPPDAS
jgi:Ca2+-dependent lipid-binding protein